MLSGQPSGPMINFVVNEQHEFVHDVLPWMIAGNGRLMICRWAFRLDRGLGLVSAAEVQGSLYSPFQSDQPPPVAPMKLP
jgi:hypothetical protein